MFVHFFHPHLFTKHSWTIFYLFILFPFNSARSKSVKLLLLARLLSLSRNSSKLILVAKAMLWLLWSWGERKPRRFVFLCIVTYFSCLWMAQVELVSSLAAYQIVFILLKQSVLVNKPPITSILITANPDTSFLQPSEITGSFFTGRYYQQIRCLSELLPEIAHLYFG